MRDKTKTHLAKVLWYWTPFDQLNLEPIQFDDLVGCKVVNDPMEINVKEYMCICFYFFPAQACNGVCVVHPLKDITAKYLGALINLSADFMCRCNNFLKSFCGLCNLSSLMLKQRELHAGELFITEEVMWRCKPDHTFGNYYTISFMMK